MYTEIEVNAAGQVWDLLLVRPYRWVIGGKLMHDGAAEIVCWKGRVVCGGEGQEEVWWMLEQASATSDPAPICVVAAGMEAHQ